MALSKGLYLQCSGPEAATPWYNLMVVSPCLKKVLYSTEPFFDLSWVQLWAKPPSDWVQALWAAFDYNDPMNTDFILYNFCNTYSYEEQLRVWGPKHEWGIVQQEQTGSLLRVWLEQAGASSTVIIIHQFNSWTDEGCVNPHFHHLRRTDCDFAESWQKRVKQLRGKPPKGFEWQHKWEWRYDPSHGFHPILPWRHWPELSSCSILKPGGTYVQIGCCNGYPWYNVLRISQRGTKCVLFGYEGCKGYVFMNQGTKCVETTGLECMKTNPHKIDTCVQALSALPFKDLWKGENGWWEMIPVMTKATSQKPPAFNVTNRSVNDGFMIYLHDSKSLYVQGSPCFEDFPKPQPPYLLYDPLHIETPGLHDAIVNFSVQVQMQMQI